MANSDNKVTSLVHAPRSGPNASGGNGNGGLTDFRLAQLEKRMDIVEHLLQQLAVLCWKMDTKLDE